MNSIHQNTLPHLSDWNCKHRNKCVSNTNHKSTRYLTPDLKTALNYRKMYSHWQQNDLVTAPGPQEIRSLPTGCSGWKSHSEPWPEGWNVGDILLGTTLPTYSGFCPFPSLRKLYYMSERVRSCLFAKRGLKTCWDIAATALELKVRNLSSRCTESFAKHGIVITISYTAKTRTEIMHSVIWEICCRKGEGAENIIVMGKVMVRHWLSKDQATH